MERLIDILEFKRYEQLAELPIADLINSPRILKNNTISLSNLGINLNSIVAPFILVEKYGEDFEVNCMYHDSAVQVIKLKLSDLVLRYASVPYELFLEEVTTDKFFIELMGDFPESDIINPLRTICELLFEDSFLCSRSALEIIDMLEEDNIRGHVYSLAYIIQEYNSYSPSTNYSATEFKEVLESKKILNKYFLRNLTIISPIVNEQRNRACSDLAPELLTAFDVQGCLTTYTPSACTKDFLNSLPTVLDNIATCEDMEDFNIKITHILVSYNNTVGRLHTSLIMAIMMNRLLKQRNCLGNDLFKVLCEV